MDKKMYITTGELAKLMGITKETLFHYDEIGLFQPAVVTENGYRYYEVGQMELLDAILLLKELGMPLKNIRELLGSRSPEKILEVFAEREQKIQEEIAKLENMERWISHRKKRIQTGLHIRTDEILVQHFPERYYLYSSVESEWEEDRYKKLNELITRFLESNPGFKSDYEVAYIQHGKDVEQGIHDRNDNAVVLLENRSSDLPCRAFPEGDYVTAYHHGNWQTIESTYDRLLAYIQEHDLLVESDYLERYLIDVLAADDMNSYVIEITVKIKK